MMLECFSIDSHNAFFTIIFYFQNRTVNHNLGSHGIPGIFVKYDLHPLTIKVREEHKPFGKFFIRLIGIIGGIFSVSGRLYISDGICLSHI